MNNRLRRSAATLAAGLLVAGLVDVTLPASSTAADPVVLKVVGTSDVSDSGLLKGQGGYLHDKILAATGLNIDYTGTATGTALTQAKNGAASALIVHAASLENQFVAPAGQTNSFSAETAGRSLMWGDYILAGYTGDKAGTAAVAAHDVVAGFKKIAQAGQAGNAHFYNRKNNSGTTVQEHELWRLVHATDPTNQIPMCNVTSANGGGMSPIDAAAGTAPTTCPANPTFPTWYVAVDRNQAANVQATNVCTAQGSNADCYVFTDRGTLQFLQASTPNTADKLTVVTRNNDPAAPGGFEALINAFHIYAINPAGVNESGQNGSQVDVPNAKKFLDYMTSPEGQAAIGGYLAQDPPFLPAAAPAVTVSQNVPGSVAGGSPVTVRGSLANKIPGYAKLSGMTVSLQGVPFSTPSAAPSTLATTTTDANGAFAFTYTPSGSTTFSLDVPGATRLQKDFSPDPKFFDILQGTSTVLGGTNVNGGLAVAKRKVKGKKLKVSGALAPQVSGPGASLVLYRAKVGKKKVLKPVASKALPAGATSYSTKFTFPRGKWKYVIVYQNPGVITPIATRQYKVTIR